MADLRSPAALSKHTSLYKAGSPLTWKDSYKKRCANRLKGSRAKLLQRYRDVGNGEEIEMEKLNSSLVDDVMREEWESIQKEDNSVSNFNQILTTMEQIKLELLIQDREILLQHDRVKEFDQNELHNSVNEHETTDQKVVCPICHSSYLEKRLNMIQCQCGLQIDTEQDCITLESIKLQLSVGSMTHAEQCDARPIFGVVRNFGPTNLLMSCNSCDFMFVVV